MSRLHDPSLDHEPVRPIAVPLASEIPRATERQARADDYDAYFGLERADSALPEWSGAWVAVSVAVLADLEESTVDSDQKLDIARGLVLVGAMTIERWTGVADSARADDDGAELDREGDSDGRHALRRWKRGHQTFHLLLVAMKTLLDDSRRLIEGQEWTRLETCFAWLTALYDAATGSMRYAADFEAEHYASVVRPTMMPPEMQPGFSGLLNRDHVAMLEAWGRTKSALAKTQSDPGVSLPQPVVAGWAELKRAQLRNRRSHSLVCSRFVPEGPSLLQQFYRTHADADAGEA